MATVLNKRLEKSIHLVQGLSGISGTKEQSYGATRMDEPTIGQELFGQQHTESLATKQGGHVWKSKRMTTEDLKESLKYWFYLL